jgi:hypothetical protein
MLTTFVQGIYSFSYTRIMMTAVLLGMVMAVGTYWFYYAVTLLSRLVSPYIGTW